MAALQPDRVQRLTLSRQPRNCGLERTNHKSPVRGSKAGCDSNWSVETGGADHTVGTGAGALAAAYSDRNSKVRTPPAKHRGWRD
jgi:hypothetical protein